MTTQLLELNEAQTAIYNRSNLRRAIKDFDDTEIAGITLRDNLVVVVRIDGSEQTYPREIVTTAYQEFTHRLKHFFSYLGPNYRGPSIWHNNGYVLFKGWTYGHALGHITARRFYNQNIRTLGISLPLKASVICNQLNSALLLTILQVMTLSRKLRMISRKNMRRIARVDRSKNN